MMNTNNDTVKLTPRSLSDYDGEFLNTDGYCYGEMPKLLRDRFNENVIKIEERARFTAYITESGYLVSSNGYVSKI
jgi:hypothetical protein